MKRFQTVFLRYGKITYVFRNDLCGNVQYRCYDDGEFVDKGRTDYSFYSKTVITAGELVGKENLFLQMRLQGHERHNVEYK